MKEKLSHYLHYPSTLKLFSNFSYHLGQNENSKQTTKTKPMSHSEEMVFLPVFSDALCMEPKSDSVPRDTEDPYKKSYLDWVEGYVDEAVLAASDSKFLDSATRLLARLDFTGKAGQLCVLHNYNLILGGMGFQSSWDPDKACGLFRDLASQISKYKGALLNFHFTEEFLNAILKYTNQGKQLGPKLTWGKQDKNNESHKAEPKPIEKFESVFLDFVGELSPLDILIQLPVCMELSAASMGFLKKESKFMKRLSAPDASKSKQEIKKQSVNIIFPSGKWRR